jgi:lipoate-protein ligase A
MAIDEAILEARRRDIVNNTIRFYQWYPSTASIGRNQIIEEEINLEFTKSHGIAVVRRISGGGAVFHDTLGEITYSIVLNNLTGISADESYIFLSDGIRQGLSKLGLHVEHDKIHCPSLFVHGRKISGNAQARRGKTLLQHGTILIDYDPELMYKVLRIPPGKTRKDTIRSVFQHVTTISRELTLKIPLDTIYQALIEGFTEVLRGNLVKGALTKWEMQKTQELIEKRYNNNEWTFKK